MRIIGYALGLLLVADGTLAAVTPRWWTDVVIPTEAKLVTQEERQIMEECRRMPFSTLRAWALWESAFGLLLLALASRIPSRARTAA
ncbi:MAG: hypothetical protein EPO21_19690 [Chloroflexota bacterium]|nr:MAG: hypothetical protein EPO21_19690 [Chloroflexota bacterium]